ncbi:hypothetical protein Poly30_30980 [Planctomycetes bacterium Poly30]|uniref:Uncharacterized protein n=1 Tax=Saltatorellus ferox TaxID=2528018 RepID=A0A518EU11_9BACT|nr:hypothetical protein Poly30_30980 [Planctomycetes bacterium Poly30]
MKYPPRPQSRSLAVSRRLRIGSLTAVAVALAGVFLWSATRSEGTERPRFPVEASDAEPSPQAGPLDPLGVHRLIQAVPFRLASPYTHAYRADQPLVSEGWLLVLGVAPDLVRPTNLFQPVLYAGLPGGTQTLERINQGHIDGVSIALLPAELDTDPSLAGVPIWFGAPELPERLTNEMIEAEATRITGLSIFRISDAALRTAGLDAGVIEVADRTRLEETAAELILQYAPGERSLAEGILID